VAARAFARRVCVLGAARVAMLPASVFSVAHRGSSAFGVARVALLPVCWAGACGARFSRGQCEPRTAFFLTPPSFPEDVKLALRVHIYNYPGEVGGKGQASGWAHPAPPRNTHKLETGEGQAMRRERK
jgi:hypothetical protein